MATTIESSERHPEDNATPALLHHGTKSILPQDQIPGVDFGAHLKNDTHDTSASPVEPRRQSESYFAQKSSPPNNDVKPIRKSNTDGLQKGESVPPAPARIQRLQRLQTAPAVDSRRPQPLARTSTLLQTMTRRKPNDGFEYTFDPMSSDSDLSSSDDETDSPNKEQRPAKPTRVLTESEKEQQKQGMQQTRKGRSYSRFKVGNELFKSKGHVSKRDGRLNISINETAHTGYLAKALGHTIKHHLDIPNCHHPRKQRQHVADHPEMDGRAHSIASSLSTDVVRPRLNIVIIVIGSRGDVQPFLKIGKLLKDEYGHRVRIATHPTFRDFVEKETDLEFFSVGGDPAELMSFMVKNPGLVPNLQTIRDGEIQRRRAGMSEMFSGMWRACINTTEDEKDVLNAKMIGEKDPFIADAIIANPPSMAHVHIAERLGIPLHIMFTFPYTPTQSFPHPLANIRPAKSNVDESYINFMSYPLVEMMTWQGLGDIVNKFRVKTLGLEPVSSLWAPGALYRMHVPYTYMWSPSLVPKPSDWGPEIDVTGFVFMELAGNYKPPQDLVGFLDAGEPPVYIGFGSIVIDDPNGFTELIVKAVQLAGVRALINKGWGGLGTTNENTPSNIFMLGNTPHDWLFPKVKAVVHHGGAGTTAMGLKCAKPTMIVPFFGDQPFWGARVAEAKAGAHSCTPWKRLTVEKLAEGIKQCLTEEAQVNVQKLAEGIALEGDAAENAVKSFHRSLPLAGKQNMRCSILEDRVAVWTLRHSSLRLSALAAEILLERKKIKYSDLKLYRVCQWNDFDGPGEPITGAAGAVTDSLYGIGAGAGMVPVRIAKHMKKRAKHERKKIEAQRRKERRTELKEEKKQRKAVEAGDLQPDENRSSGWQDNDASNRRPPAHREETSNTLASTISADPTTPLATEIARDFGEGFKRAGGALLTMPNDLHVAIAQGFHNAPRLWGDITVRKPIRITGFKTGMSAAGREFAYGIYDAWTGLVTQPVGGFKDGDTVPAKLAGLGTGTAKGLGGFVLKNVSALISPPAYAGKGVIVYLTKKANGPGSKAYLRRAHLVIGQKDLQALRQQDDAQQLRRIEQLVDEGLKVYDDIWVSAKSEFGPGRGNLVGRIKFNREKQRWKDAGALENTHAAQRALEVRRQGGDVQTHFAKRRQELELAEQPRASAMEQPGEYERRVDDRDHGENTHASETAEKEKLGPVFEDDPDGDRSDSTAVASSVGDEKKHRDSTSGHVDVFKKMNGGQMAALGRVTTA